MSRRAARRTRSEAGRAASTATSPGVSACSPRPSASGGSRPGSSKLATCPHAWTPASVRPATLSATLSPSISSIAASSSAWTVRCPGWVAQPANSVPL